MAPAVKRSKLLGSTELEQLDRTTFRAGAVAFGCIVVAVFALFHGLFFGQLPASNDIVTNDLIENQYPLRALFSDAIRHGHFPLWTPYIHAGFPIFAEGQGGFLYPPTILLALLCSPLAAIDVYLIAHAVVMGWGMYRWTRRMTGSDWAAIVPATAASICGSLVAGHTRTLNAFAVIALTPWLMDCAEQFIEGNLRYARRKAVARAGLIGGLMVLAGHPQFTFIALSLMAGYLLLRSRSWRGAGAAAAFAIGAVAISIAIGWPQLRDTVEMAALSDRHGTPSAAFVDAGSLPWSGIMTFVSPYFAGDAGAASFRGADFYLFWEGFHYCGVLTALLALAGAVHGWRRFPAVPAMASMAVVCYLLSVGGHFPLYGLLRHLPGVGIFRFPARWLLGTELSVLTLAAFGMPALFETAPAVDRSERHRCKWSTIVALAVVAEIFAVAGRQCSTVDPSALLGPAQRSAAMVPAGSRLFVVGDSDLQGDAYLQSRGWERETSAYPAALADLPPNLPAVYRVSEVRGYTALGSRCVASVWGDTGHFGVVSQCTFVDASGTFHVRPNLVKLLRMWRVGAVKSPWPLPGPFVPVNQVGPILTYRLPESMPRAWVVPAAANVSSTGDDATARMLIDDRFNPNNLALVSGAAPRLPTASSPGVVSIADEGDEALTMRASAAGLVVLSDTWYPRWRAKVDGKPATVYRVNDCMRGVVAPRASAVIRMWYDDEHLAWWIALSLLWTLIAGVFAFRPVNPDQAG